MIASNGVIAAGRFSPRHIAGLEFWGRADDVVDVGGGVVSQWNDRSGNARHATQSTGSARGTLVTNATLRNRPGVSLDGGDWYTTSAFSLPNVLSVFFVLGAVTARGMIAEHGLGTHWYAYSTGNAAAYFLSHNTFQNPVTTWAQANQQGAVIYDRSSAPALRGNRSTLTPTSTAGSAPSAGTVSAALAIGGRPDGSLRHTGVIHEVLVYSRALTANEIARVEHYLFGRYGV